MKWGFLFQQEEVPEGVESLVELVNAVVDLGLDHFVTGDHVVLPDRAAFPNAKHFAEDIYHEPITLAVFVAAISPLDVMTTLVMPQRQAALVAKQHAELDLLSGSRNRIATGLGWNRLEYQAMGATWDDRTARLEDQIAVMRMLWGAESVTYESAYHSLDSVGLCLQPAQGSVPIWMASGCAPRAIDRVGRLGDGWYPLVLNSSARGRPSESADGLEEVIAALATIRQVAEEHGRDPSLLGVQGRVDVGDGDASRIGREIEQWIGLGATHIAFDTREAGLDSVEQHVESLALAADVARHRA